MSAEDALAGAQTPRAAAQNYPTAHLQLSANLRLVVTKLHHGGSDSVQGDKKEGLRCKDDVGVHDRPPRGGGGVGDVVRPSICQEALRVGGKMPDVQFSMNVVHVNSGLDRASVHATHGLERGAVAEPGLR